VLKQLKRRKLVSAAGAETLREAAMSLRESVRGDGEEGISVDGLLVRWMDLWGSWDYQEDRELLLDVLSRFTPRSPSRSSRSPTSKPGTPSGRWGRPPQPAV
jgi:hypothetical protein